MLPETFQVARLAVEPGEHSVLVSSDMGSEVFFDEVVSLRPGQKRFVFVRGY